MARFLASVRGSRGSVSRLGSKNSGIHAEARGWDSGIRVYGEVNSNDKDVFWIYVTGGSHDASSARLIGSVTVHDGFPVVSVSDNLNDSREDD